MELPSVHARRSRVALLILTAACSATPAFLACGSSGEDDGGSTGGGDAGASATGGKNGGSTGGKSGGSTGGKNGGSTGGEDAGGATGTGGRSGSGGVLGGDGGTIGSGSALGAGGATETGECNDGIDNDGDGFTDFAFDPGCYGPGDQTETAGARAEENGFTTWEFGADSVVVYVSSDGDDGSDGSSPDKAVATLARADDLVRDGKHDFILLRRGDTFRTGSLGTFKSGQDGAHPIVIGSYGEERELPTLELSETLIDHNGQDRSFIALMDLHLYLYTMDPESPDFTGNGGGALRLVGTGSDILIEGCHFEYGETILQGYQGTYDNVEFRANVIERAYRTDTCVAGDPEGNADARRSGVFAKGVNGLLFEGNLLDHNGWNKEDVPSACATIYNHNLYLNANDLVIRGNVFTRASSIHIKLQTKDTGEMQGILIEDNYFTEGEIGVSMGGNGDAPYRFQSAVLSRNVFSDVGRGRPTGRDLAWAVDLMDNDESTIVENLFLNQVDPGARNSRGITIKGDTERDLTIENNLFYRIQNQAILVRPAAGHEGVVIKGNTLVDPDQNAVLVSQDGAFTGYTYSNNEYSASSGAGSWFEINSQGTSFDDWVSASEETGAKELGSVEFTDPSRTLETYSDSLGLGGTLEAYLGRALQQNRLTWSPALTASAINGYVRAGFNR